MGKRLMGLDGMGWEGMEYIEKISSKYLQNSTNKISKINNFYSTSNWIHITYNNIMTYNYLELPMITYNYQ